MHKIELSTMPLRPGVAFLLWLCSCLTFSGCTQPKEVSDPDVLLRDAKKALRQSEFGRVDELVRQIPRDSEIWQSAMLVAGEAATKESDFDRALETYKQAADKDRESQDGLLATFSAAEILLETGRLTSAEQLYLEVLDHQPGNGLTNERMAFLSSLTGRRWGSLKHYAVLVRGGDSDYRELALAADVGRPLEQPEFLKKCVEQAPDDKLVRLAVAVQAFDEGDPESLRLLRAFVADHPNEAAGQTLLAQLLLDTQDESEFVQWFDRLPEGVRTEPDAWFVCGLWSRKQGDLKAAADCLWNAVTAMPFHRRAVYSLGQTLVALEDPQAEEVTRYSELLVALSQSVDQVLVSEGRNAGAAQKSTELLLQLGRIWEACAWAQFSVKAYPDAVWAQEILTRHGSSLTSELPMVKNALLPREDADYGKGVHFVALLKRKMSSMDSVRKPNALSSPSTPEGIRFLETSAIPFTYSNADDPSTKGVRSFEQTGGGVAIIDFDLDNAPDVFLPQGIEWKTGDVQPAFNSELADGLFRNRSGQRFENAAVGMPDQSSGFGQGCAAGDFDNDGFPDLYVANVGRNALKQNMGDGTFQDVTNEAGISQNEWTSSVLICDLNADAMPDLFDVNYLTGNNVYEMICMGRACSPSVFSGSRDTVLINNGDGTFETVADLAPEANSKGLGVVAFSSAPGQARMDLFVANDQVGNHFLRNKDSANAFRLEFAEDSLTSGLAYNEYGLPMACMGVAADDWDGNNLLDLFVTNFHNESNTMYLQDAHGLFLDATNSMGLKAASLPFTGWGTQSLDANLDGYPDLVIANGHVDDYRDVGGEYHMRPQCFQHRGDRFEELFGKDCGEWFDRKFLGRGLARVDWNLDGKPEFIVSNINSPVAVLQNETKNAGHFLTLRMIATASARDASGAFATLDLGDRTVVKQLTMGDGYMASNERVIQFGLGERVDVGQLTIQWPSGMTTTIAQPLVDTALTIVEGHGTAYRVPAR